MFGFVPDFRGPGDPRRYWLGLVAAIFTGAFYVSLIVNIDNTNLGTTNGLWKAPLVSDWEHARARPVDSGEFLYLDLYGHLARVIPDSWLRYGTAPRDVTFRKMAIWNGVLGGIASGCVFVLALLVSSSRMVAAAIWILHAGAGFVLLNSINSEDIIPAYTCIVAAILCIIEFFQSAHILSFLLSAFLVALAILLHWTTFAPALAGLVAVWAVVTIMHPRFFWMGAVWVFAMVSSLKLMMMAAYPMFRDVALRHVLVPGKVDAAGWVGLSGEKMRYFLQGVGNYFSGANNIASFRLALETPAVLHSMIFSWVVLAIAMASCWVAALRRSSRPTSRILAIFALAMFAAGEAGAIYSQPQDPQMQIEPMFVVIAGMMLLPWSDGVWRKSLSPGLTAGAVLPRGESGRWRFAAAGALVLFAMNGVWNVHLMTQLRGLDSQAYANVAELDRLFPRETTVVACQGMEGWTTWQYVLLWDGHWAEWMQRNFQLARPFTTVRGISGDGAAEMVESEINAARVQGLRVVSDAIWTGTEQEAVGSYTTVTTEANARAFVAKLREKFRAGEHWDTAVGRFVEVLPARD